MNIPMIIGAAVIAFIAWKLSPVRNSHRIPQSIKVPEFHYTGNDPELALVEKGHTLTLSREKGTVGYHLIVTITTNGMVLSDLKHIFINWDQWGERMFTFRYTPMDDSVDIQGDKIRIDIGSFNNCPGSKNFLKRSYYSNMINVTLLDYTPEPHDYEYEKDIAAQSVFCSSEVRNDLKLFRKGVHYVDS